MGSTTSKINDTRSDVVGATAQETPRTEHRATTHNSAARRRSPNADRLASQSRSRTRVAPGIYKDRWALTATVKVNGVQREVCSPPG